MRCAVSRFHRSQRRRRQALGARRARSSSRSAAPASRACSSRTGALELYAHPSRGKVKLWDACAPDAIVRAAGGVFTDAKGTPFDYRGPVAQGEGTLAANADAPRGGAAPVRRLRQAHWRRDVGVRDHAEVVVIGAGIMGLSIAYHLARLGVTRRRGRRQELPVRRRERAQRRRRARAVVERGERPAHAGEHPHVPGLRERVQDQRLVPPGRLPVPRAQRGAAPRARGELQAAARVRALDAHAHAARGAEDRARALDRRRRGRELQPRRRRRLPVALRVGLRAGGDASSASRSRPSPRSSASTRAARRSRASACAARNGDGDGRARAPHPHARS